MTRKRQTKVHLREITWLWCCAWHGLFKSPEFEKIAQSYPDSSFLASGSVKGEQACPCSQAVGRRDGTCGPWEHKRWPLNDVSSTFGANPSWPCLVFCSSLSCSAVITWLELSYTLVIPTLPATTGWKSGLVKHTKSRQGEQNFNFFFCFFFIQHSVFISVSEVSWSSLVCHFFCCYFYSHLPDRALRYQQHNLSIFLQSVSGWEEEKH